MSRDLDELFGEGEGTPKPRTRLVRVLLGSGLLLTLAGLACSSAPGGVLVLAAYGLVETDMRRVENGYLPADTRSEVRRSQQQAFAGLLAVLVVFGIQGALVCGGFYDLFWTQVLSALAALFGLPAPGAA